MQNNKCQYILTYGPRKGERCNRSTDSSSIHCDLCLSRMELTEKLPPEENGHRCKNNSDPYNGQICYRFAAFNGYCLLCLSQE